MARGRKNVKFTLRDKRALNKATRVVNAIELNVHETTIANPAQAGAVVNLMNLAQGLDSNERIGDSVMPVRIEVRGKYVLNASATASTVRLVILRDNAGTTTQPTIIEAFGSVANFRNNNPAIGDSQQRARFTILWDKFITIESGNSSGTIKAIAMKKRLARRKVHFTGATATDEGKNCIYLFHATDEATNVPAATALVKLWYNDV